MFCFIFSFFQLYRILTIHTFAPRNREYNTLWCFLFFVFLFALAVRVAIQIEIPILSASAGDVAPLFPILALRIAIGPDSESQPALGALNSPR